MNQIQTLLCKSHPKEQIIAANVSQTCPSESRFACLECTTNNKEPKSFVHINNFHSSIEATMNQAVEKGVSKIVQMHYYLTIQGKQLVENQNKLMAVLQKFINEVKTVMTKNVDYIKEFYLDVAILKKIYQDELNKVTQKWESVDISTNYHRSSEWRDLESQMNKFIKLFSNEQSSQISSIMNKIKVRKQQYYEQYQQICDLSETQSKELGTMLRNLRTQEQQSQTMQQQLNGDAFWKRLLIRIPFKTDPKLIFKGSKDGMNAQAFWKKCENVEATLIICKSKSQAIFGGFTPCKWLKNEQLQSDPSLTSYLFSFTKKEIYALNSKTSSIIGFNKLGFAFGDKNELRIDEDFQTGCSILDNSCYSTDGFKISNPEIHLMGGKQPDLIELEVYTFI